MPTINLLLDVVVEEDPQPPTKDAAITTSKLPRTNFFTFLLNIFLTSYITKFIYIVYIHGIIMSIIMYITFLKFHILMISLLIFIHNMY